MSPHYTEPLQRPARRQATVRAEPAPPAVGATAGIPASGGCGSRCNRWPVKGRQNFFHRWGKHLGQR
ncbi:hypothetical protein [Desulfotomaculum defluvii]